MNSADIVTVVSLVTPVMLAIIAYYARRQDISAKQVAIKVEEVAVAAQAQDSKLDEIHTLVNSNMGAQLQVSMIALRRVANLTNDSADVAIADNAEDLYHQHEAKQALVDSKAKV